MTDVDWGPFEAAIRRWEQVSGRPAPRPTEGDAHRLSPHFVEWMMGLPEGWVTGLMVPDVDPRPLLSRSQALKILGNGVVPAQAAAAITMLIA